MEWQDRDEPFVPFYPADPLYGAQQDDPSADEDLESGLIPALPAVTLVFVTLALVGAVLGVRRRE